MAYESIASHRTMALDAVRNRAYERALAQVITPDTIVLDLGAGTGVLGLMAARLGARRVYLVEPTDVIAVARELAAANGLADRVHCFHGRLDAVDLPEKVDVIVSVMTGHFLVTEDLLPVLFQARDTVLRPGGHLIPDAAVMEATIVSAPAVHDTQIASWSSEQYGIDMTAARAYAANTVIYNAPRIREVEYLAAPGRVHAVDFARDRYAALHATIDLEATSTGLCHAVAGWFRMRLGDEWLSTSPRDERVHWSAVLFPIDPPLPVEAGQRVRVSLDREPQGEWGWRVETADGKRRHSALLSMALTESTLRRSALDFVPHPAAGTRALLKVLSDMDGRRSVTVLAARLRAAFPANYATEREAVAYVQQVVAQYCGAPVPTPPAGKVGR